MILSFFAAAQGAAIAAQPLASDVTPPQIVVTAALVPVPEEEAPATVTVIEQDRIEALGEPLASDLLRLVPAVAVATSGPPGTQTQVRIRGAEANHTLLLIDGIRFNDPASGNEPRFEMLTTDGVRRIEVVRGPQSALYGAEAIGGVVALFTGRDRAGAGGSALLEGGSHDFVRAAATAGLGQDGRSIDLYGGYQRSDGIDVLGGGSGDRDGYDNLTLGGAAQLSLSPTVELRLSGRFVDSESEFDGVDPRTFRRADTGDESHNRIGAVRLAAALAPAQGWELVLGGTYLGSSNRNLQDGAPRSRTSGERIVLDTLASRDFATGGLQHRIAIAADYEDEAFIARDQAFGGGTDQDRSRERASLAGEWRASFGSRLTADLAVRQDVFEGFRDATTVRGSLLVRVSGPLSALLGYGEGIARPTFFELFGFFPDSFVGNRALRPERSESYEAGLRYRRDRFGFELTAYRQRLENEIVSVFDPTTFLSSVENASGESRRGGVEAEARWNPAGNLLVTATYAFVDAEEQRLVGGSLSREVRRPRHSGSIAVTGEWNRIRAGASLAYVGSRSDLDFDEFPARRVRLDDYVLADARLAYSLSDRIEAFGRIANAFDSDYQDVVGFRTPGRTVYAGIRLRFRE